MSPNPSNGDPVSDSVNEDLHGFLRNMGDLSITQVKDISQARGAYLYSKRAQLSLDKLEGQLVSVDTLVGIRDDTVQLINDLLGASLGALLRQYGVPKEITQGVHQDVHQGLVRIYAKHSNSTTAADGDSSPTDL